MTFMNGVRSGFIVCLFLICIVFVIDVHAQQKIKDSLHYQLSLARTGRDSIPILKSLGKYSTKDTGIYYLNQALKIAQRLGDEAVIFDINFSFGFYYRSLGDYVDAIKFGQKMLQAAETKRDTLGMLRAYMILVFCYSDMSDSVNRNFYSDKSLELYEKGFINRIADADTKLSHEFIYHNYKGGLLFRLGKIDSAIYHFRINLEKARLLKDKQWIGISALALAGRRPGDDWLSLWRESWQASRDIGRYDNAAYVLLKMSNFYHNKGQTDSALYYSKLALQMANIGGESNMKLDAFRKLFDLYEPISRDSAYQYLESWSLLNDSLYGKEEINRIQSLNINERSRLDAEANNRVVSEQRKAANNRFLFLLAATLLLLAIVGFFYQNNRNRKKSHQKLQQTYDELKATQAQLIQSEKMASLGELTAGIAHEIQNPLNFVNNFSELNTELVEELKAERLKPNAERNEQLENEILNDIKANEEKINHHGKRADAIVKGMLQHSRSSSSTKELTDINALCDEYLRLAYHGLRAKDKSFNAKFETGFDNAIEKVNIMPQEIGRVILNLINNAFYAVNEKAKSLTQNADSYEPTVTVTTKKENSKIIIAVKDNGTGIPQKVADKIFQPFFTTKPTGQGTGLGLSLSYDIVKAHGGEIRVETKEGEDTIFIVTLPL